MDVSQYNTRVIKEPRGMIRIVQLVFAILAFATTSGFDTTTSFTQSCRPAIIGNRPEQIKISYSVEYPFKFKDQYINVWQDCKSNKTVPKDYDMEFSSSAQFYVATGVLSFLYTIACLVLYIFGTRHYETNPLIPVIDLVASGVLAIFWLSGACAWAAGVSDVKYYTDPKHLWSKLDFCKQNQTSPENCIEDSPGKWASLNISLIFGFANVFLWGASMWFVFKETSFHRKPTPDQMTTPGQTTGGFGAYGDQGVAQPQMQSQPHFPQQKQFADGY